jgi:mitochondrial fission protein ELM1
MSGPGSLGPSVWAVSDGRAGNAAQVRAIVQALGETRRWMKIGHVPGEAHRAEPIVLTPRMPWTWLPADNWPSPLSALPADQRALLQPPWPTVWIAAGRRSAAFTRAVREWSGGRTLTVQILDPRIPPDNFDLLVTPKHDGVTGPNVIQTVGSPPISLRMRSKRQRRPLRISRTNAAKAPLSSWVATANPTPLQKRQPTGSAPSCASLPEKAGACG